MFNNTTQKWWEGRRDCNVTAATDKTYMALPWQRGFNVGTYSQNYSALQQVLENICSEIAKIVSIHSFYVLMFVRDLQTFL